MSLQTSIPGTQLLILGTGVTRQVAMATTLTVVSMLYS